RLGRAVDAVERVAVALEQVQRTCAERVLDAAGHAVGVRPRIRIARQHLRRRRPRRPCLLGLDGRLAGPGEAFAANADAVAERLAAGLDQIEVAVGRID